MTTGRPSSYRWVVMSTFSITHAIAIIGAMVLGILLPAITEDLGLSPSEQGWLGSSALIGNLVFSLPFGWWLSRYGAWRMTTITLSAGAFFVFVQGWAPTFALLLVGRLLFGLTVIARDPAKALLIRQWLPGKEVGLFNVIFNAVFGVALTAGFVVTPFVLEAFDEDWRMILYTYAILNGGLALVWIILGRERAYPDSDRRRISQEDTPLRSLVKYKELWLVGFGMLGYSIAQMAQLTFWPTFMKETYDMSLVTSGSLIGLLGLVVAAGGFVVLPLMSRAGGHRIPLVVIGLATTGTFLGVLVTDSVPVLVVSFVINGVMRGAFWTIFNTIPFELPDITPRGIAVAQSMMYTMFWAGGFLGPILVGFLHETTDNLELGMVVSSICPVGISLTALLLPGRVRRQSAGAHH